MGSFSNYLENALINHVFGTGAGHKLAYTPPTVFIALCTVAVTDSLTGATITEPTAGREGAGQYSRVAMATWDQSTADHGATENTNDILFAQATADWGKILDFAIVDTSTVGAGNLLAYGSLTISKSVQSGDTPKFATGDLDITLT